MVVTQGDISCAPTRCALNVAGKDNKPDKIFANGNVVVDAPISGTATGDKGIYDVVAHTVTMTGNVVLTQDKDVMRGTQLTVNLDTGVGNLGWRQADTGIARRARSGYFYAACRQHVTPKSNSGLP